MPDRHAGLVNEQELHIAKGAYDQVHHAHGYQWTPERHHWYWFAGIALSVIATLCGGVAYVLFDRSMAPVCERSGSVLRPSPNGARIMETVLVNCGSESTRKVLIYDAGGANNVPAAASFSEDANVRVRWRSDTEVVLSKTGGRVWNFRPVWRDVRLHYETR